MSVLSSLPASDPPFDDTKDSLEGDLEAGVGKRQGAIRQAGGGDGDGAPTPGLWRSPKPCR